MKARSFRALLLISSLMLSTGTTALPVVAADISPDTSDSGISIDADDSSTITPDDSTMVPPDNNTGLVPDDTTGNTGTGIVPDGEGTDSFIMV